MPIRDNDLLVYFGKYCKSCKHEKLEENEPPCDECLEHPVNLNSHKGECLWVEWKVNLYTVKSCPYISTQSFAQNWELPRYNSK